MGEAQPGIGRHVSHQVDRHGCQRARSLTNSAVALPLSTADAEGRHRVAHARNRSLA
jgi:hypothetical protein